MTMPAVPDTVATDTGNPPDYVEGVTGTENPPQGDTYQAADMALPPGVHPHDPSQLWAGGPLPDAVAAPPDTAGSRSVPGSPVFDTDNEHALGVYQRSASDWTGNRIVVDTNNSGTVQVCGRQKGRYSVTLKVPTGAPQGVVIAPTEGEVLNSASCPILLPGDAPLVLYTEGPVWAGVISGQTTGTVDVFVTFNPTGGAYGGQ